MLFIVINNAVKGLVLLSHTATVLMVAIACKRLAVVKVMQLPKCLSAHLSHNVQV